MSTGPSGPSGPGPNPAPGPGPGTVTAPPPDFGGCLIGSTGNNWAPKTNSPTEWISGGSTRLQKFVGIATQGRQNTAQWCSSYSVEHTVDGVTWIAGPTFTANTDNNGLVRNDFPSPITALAIRIHPLTFNSWPSMRVEFFIKTKTATSEIIEIRQVTGDFGPQIGTVSGGSGLRHMTVPFVFNPPLADGDYETYSYIQACEISNVTVWNTAITGITQNSCIVNASTWGTASITALAVHGFIIVREK
eukprot:gene13309-15645_t